MPELPEVETVRIGLQTHLPALQIKSLTFDWPKGFPNSPALVKKALIGATVEAVNRRGKVIIIPLSTGFSILVHLKMTGQLVYLPTAGEGFGGGHPSDSLVAKLPDRSTRVTISFTSGAKLYFNDQRKFGWVKLEKSLGLYDSNLFLSKLGPEPLTDDYTFEQFSSALSKRKKTTIKAAILDQTVLAGVGNIYADEGLFAARIHPATRVGDVSTIKLKRLFTALREIMLMSIELGGSSARNYVDAEGKKGNYLNFAKVYGRKGKNCAGCSGKVTKIRVASRGTHICTSCQKLVKPKK